jgi:hypothetical protein
MKVLVRLFSAACCLVGLCSAAPIYWTGPGGNGHGYEGVDTLISWTDINALATSRGGHVVTITSAAEQAFVFSNFGGMRRWIGASDAVTEGTFKWITDEPFVYTNWDGGEPNDDINGGTSNGEDLAELRVNGKWNDIPQILSGAQFQINGLIEYEVSADPTSVDNPEPASALLVASALFGAVAWRRSKRKLSSL